MENLKLDYNNGELYLDLKDPDNKNIIKHLVSRYGNQSYYSKYTVDNNSNKK